MAQAYARDRQSRHIAVRRGDFLTALTLTLGAMEAAPASSAPAGADAVLSLRHFYVYNETNVDIATTTEYVPLFRPDHPEDSPLRVRRNTVIIRPGSQTMLCTTYNCAVITSSVSGDGTMHWSKVMLQSQQDEYTHVISVSCDRLLPQCSGYPRTWPNAVTRQLSDEESGVQ
jgi:hypothetical protein